MIVTHVLWGWSVLTLLVDIVLVSWLWRTLEDDNSVPGQPGAVRVGHTMITGQTQALIMVGLYMSNVCLVICTFGLILDAFLKLVQPTRQLALVGWQFGDGALANMAFGRAFANHYCYWMAVAAPQESTLRMLASSTLQGRTAL